MLTRLRVHVFFRPGDCWAAAWGPIPGLGSQMHPLLPPSLSVFLPPFLILESHWDVFLYFYCLFYHSCSTPTPHSVRQSLHCHPGPRAMRTSLAALFPVPVLHRAVTPGTALSPPTSPTPEPAPVQTVAASVNLFLFCLFICFPDSVVNRKYLLPL